MRLEMYLDGPSISMNVLMPESWLNGGVSSGKTVWLLHDKMDLASDWLSFTQAELYAEQASVAFVCVSTLSARYTNWQSGCTWETFFTQDMWDYVHEIFPILSRRPEDNLLFGYGRGGFGAIKYTLTYPEKYGAAYSVAYNDQPVLDAMNGVAKVFPTTGTGYGTPEEVACSNDNLPWLIQRFAASGKRKPPIHLVVRTEDAGYQRTMEIFSCLKANQYNAVLEEEPGRGRTQEPGFAGDVNLWFYVNEQLGKAVHLF